MICKRCGQVLADGVRICPICKTVQDDLDVHTMQEVKHVATEEILRQERQDDEQKANGQEAQVQSTEIKQENVTVPLEKQTSLKEGIPASSIWEESSSKVGRGKKYPYPPRSRVLAGLLQIFFGGFGIGRFYLGYNGIAIGQLFTMPILGIGAIWGIIDGILILCGQVPCDVNGVPLN